MQKQYENQVSAVAPTKPESNKDRRDSTRVNFLGDFAYSIDEACDILNIGKTFIYSEIKAGRLKARRCGARRLILASELNRYLLSLPEI